MKSTTKYLMLPCVVGMFAWSQSVTAVEKTLQAVMSPGTDVVVRFDVKTLNASPFVKQLKAMSKKDTGADKSLQEALAKFGIQPEDIGDIAIGVDLDPKGAAGGEPTPSFTMAITNNKSWNLNTLQTQIMALAKEEKETIPTMSILTLDGVSVLKIDKPEDAENDGDKPGMKVNMNVENAFVAALDNGKLLLITSLQNDMAKGIRRLKANQFSPNPKMGAFYNSKAPSQICGAFILTDAMKQTIQEKQKQAAGAPQGMNPMAGVQGAFSSIQGIGWFVNCGEKNAVVNLKLGLGNAQDATKGTTALKGFVDMMKGMMAMQEGQPNPQAQMAGQFFNALTVKNTNSSVFIKLDLPMDFIVAAQKEAEKKAAKFLAPPMEE